MGFILCGCEAEPKGDKPNIIVILADDLGYGDIAAYGNTDIRTPNIDYLAQNGIRFTDFHSNGPVCSPTRAALLTGNYQQRAGLEGVVYNKGEARQTGLGTGQVTIDHCRATETQRLHNENHGEVAPRLPQGIQSDTSRV